ncbi:MAG: hypothetical protein FJX61_12995 [Alphaproteobacteria bacterium]|nr:hypothetical protein [Alphaproteobacteria bacterium]
MLSRRWLLAIAAVAVLPLGACQVPAPAPTLPELTYAHLGPIRLDVARIEIVDDYLPPLRRPNVEHEFPIPPADAARRWVNDRLQAAGRQRTARFFIRTAAVVETKLDRRGGLAGAFTTDQSERYNATLEVALEIRSESGQREAYVEARSENTRTVSEKASINDRERVYFEMTEFLMKAVNAELEAQINQHFGRFRR